MHGIGRYKTEGPHHRLCKNSDLTSSEKEDASVTGSFHSGGILFCYLLFAICYLLDADANNARNKLSLILQATISIRAGAPWFC